MLTSEKREEEDSDPTKLFDNVTTLVLFHVNLVNSGQLKI